jgi:hypothetical protein
MKRTTVVLILAVFGWLAPPPLPNPACAVPYPYHCDPKPHAR